MVRAMGRLCAVAGWMFVQAFAACVLLFAWLNTERGAAMLDAGLSRRLSTSDRFVRLTGFSVRWPGTATAASLAIADAKGEWLRVERLSVACDMPSLWRGHPRIGPVDAALISMRRRPASKSAPAGAVRRPPPVLIGPVRVAKLLVHEKVFGRALDVGCEGVVGLQLPDRVVVQARVTGWQPEPVDGVVELSGSTGRMRIRFAAEGDGVAEGRVLAGDAHVAAVVDVGGSGVQGACGGRARLVDREWDGETAFAFRGRELRLRQTVVHGEGLQVFGGLRIDFAETNLQGDVHVECEELGRYSGLAGIAAAGRVAGDATFQLGVQTQRVAARVAATGLTVQSQTVARAGANIVVTDLFGERHFEAAGEFAGLGLGGRAIDSGVLQVTGTLSAVSFHVEAGGVLESNVAVTAAGSLARRGAGYVLNLEDASVRRGDFPVSLCRPCEVWYAPAGPEWVVSNLCVVVTGCVVTVGGRLAGADVDAWMTVSDMPLRRLPFERLHALEGTIGLQGRLGGTLSRPRVDVWMHAAEVRSPQLAVAEAPSLTADARVGYSNDLCSVSVGAEAGRWGSLQVGGTLSAVFSLAPFELAVDTQREVRADLTCNADLSFVSLLPHASQHKVEGRLAAELTYTGGLHDGRTEGRCVVEDIQYEHLLLGTLLRDGRVELEGGPGGIVVKSATATDGGEGRLSADGELSLKMDRHFPFRLNVHAEKARLVRTDLATVETSGLLQMEGCVTNVTLAGNLTIGSATVHLDSLPAAPPKTLEMFAPTEIAESETNRALRVARPRVMAVGGRVDVKILPQLAVVNDELDSLWQGGLTVTWVEGAPVVVGLVQPRRGRFFFVKRRFDLTDGSVRFDGSLPSVPLLDITAEHRRTDVTAIIRITGRANAPEFTITSEPAMPRDEILSFVLFGKGRSAITPLQALELASAARSLRTGRAGESILGRARSRLGVDLLQLEERGEGGDGQAEVVVGKQLSDRLYLEMNASLIGGGVQAEYEIRPNLTVETDVGAAMRPGLGLNWKKDY